MRDYRYSADRLFVGDNDRDFDWDRGDTGERLNAGRNEAGYRQHPFVAVVVTEARNVRIDRSCGGCVVTREMRMHLPRVVMGGLVVIEVDVRHRSGDGAHLHGNG